MRRSFGTIVITLLIISTLLSVQPVAGNSTISRTLKTNAGDNPPIFSSPGIINTIIPLENESILVGGQFTALGSETSPSSLAIIKSDGTIDPAFQVDENLGVYEIYDAARQSDGKIVLAGIMKLFPTGTTTYLVRLNTDGSLDTTFNPPNIFYHEILTILIDGTKIMVGGSTPYQTLVRLNSDGSLDSSFNLTGTKSIGGVYDIALQSNGKYIIVSDINEREVMRLDQNGSVDTSFITPYISVTIDEVTILNDDYLLIGGDNQCNAGQIFFRLDPNGQKLNDLLIDPNQNFKSIDALLSLQDGGFLVGGWNMDPCMMSGLPYYNQEGKIYRYDSSGTYQSMISFGISSNVLSMDLRSDGNLVVGGFARADFDNQIGLFEGLQLIDLSDGNLNRIAGTYPQVGAKASIGSLSRYSDGKLLVGGNFTHVNGEYYPGVARLLANGKLDASFHPFADIVGKSYAVLALPDGRALAGINYGLYLISQLGERTDISSINHNQFVTALALQNDQKVLVNGGWIKRLNSDFSGTDPTFIPEELFDIGEIFDIEVKDDKIYVGGSPIIDDGYNSAIIRLNLDGSRDTTFTPSTFMIDDWNYGSINDVVPLANGKIMVAGNFQKVGGVTTSSPVRLNADGSLDSSFQKPDGVTGHAICAQDDQTFWLGATIPEWNRGPIVFLLKPNGTIDSSSIRKIYDLSIYNSYVIEMLCDSAGLNAFAGSFTLVEDQPVHSLMVFFNKLFFPAIIR